MNVLKVAYKKPKIFPLNKNVKRKDREKEFVIDSNLKYFNWD